MWLKKYLSSGMYLANKDEWSRPHLKLEIIQMGFVRENIKDVYLKH